MNDDDRIRSEIQALIRRGNITPAELAELRCNSWEWEALTPALTDEALVERVEHTLKNCFTKEARPFSTYDEAIKGLYVPELLRRFGAASREARTFAEVIDNVREALGQKVTHYLVVADDVKELVETVDAGGDAQAVLRKIRAEPGSGQPRKCWGCSVEAEIGTEENPHPVPERFHVCVPIGASGRRP